jgi:hypothetical protein
MLCSLAGHLQACEGQARYLDDAALKRGHWAHSELALTLVAEICSKDKQSKFCLLTTPTSA